jgi:hypothetical protein
MRSPSKNMCSVRVRPMPLAPKAMAMRVCSGVSALVRTARRVAFSAPGHELEEVLELLGLLGGLVVADEPVMISLRSGLELAAVDRAGGAVDAEVSPSLKVWPEW